MDPGVFLGLFLQAWLTALAALIAYRLLTGRIVLKGLLAGANGRFSPERLQLLVITLGSLGFFAMTALQEKRMPQLDASVVGTLGASNLLYLGGKALRRVFDKSPG